MIMIDGFFFNILRNKVWFLKKKLQQKSFFLVYQH